MDQSRQGRRRSRAPVSQIDGQPASVELRRAAEDPRTLEKGSGKFWFSRRFVDLPKGSQVNRAGVWDTVPSCPCQSHLERIGLDTAKANPASQAAQRRRDQALEGRTVAGVEKKAAEEGRTIVFIDESGFYLLPMVVRTYAPCGCTPIVHEYLSYDHLSVIGAITPEGRLFLKTYEHSITSREVVAFLTQLLRLIPGLLLVIWDGNPTHRSKAIKAYLATGAARRIHLEQLPGYAPELNPIEWVWSYLKVADLANLACDNLSALDTHLQKAKKMLQHKHEMIKAFILDAGYEV